MSGRRATATIPRAASAAGDRQDAQRHPAGISISNDNTCQGTAKTLTVLGGSLGDGADWYWYSDATYTTLVGTGVSVVVDPAVSTTYYVRAEGDCNTTTSVSQLVTVRVPSVDPTGISVTNDNACVGTSKTLTVPAAAWATGLTGTGTRMRVYHTGGHGCIDRG
jgi:hypothetical protein